METLTDSVWFQIWTFEKVIIFTYAAVRDDQGDFQGVLEYVQDIKPFFELESDAETLIKASSLALLVIIIFKEVRDFALCLSIFYNSFLSYFWYN